MTAPEPSHAPSEWVKIVIKSAVSLWRSMDLADLVLWLLAPLRSMANRAWKSWWVQLIHHVG